MPPAAQTKFLDHFASGEVCLFEKPGLGTLMKTNRCTAAILLLAGAWHAAGQTAVDLTRQGKLAAGTSLPAQCAVGQIFLKTDAPPGTNLYACLINGWSVMGPAATNSNTILNGSGTPANGIGADGDFFLRTDTNCLYGPKVSGAWPGTCVSVIGPPGAGMTPAWSIVDFSSTPTFMVTSPMQVFEITLAGNVTSSTITGTSSDGQDVTFKICEDGIGGRTFAPPASMVGFGTVDTTPGVCNIQSFRYDASDNFVAITKMRTDKGNPQLSENNGLYPLPAAPQAIVGTSDARLADARTPTAHAATHQNGGADEVGTATPGPYAIPKAGSSGTLAAAWLPPIASGATIPAPNITGHPTIEGVTSTGANGTGALVFSTSPTLTTPNLGAASATTINKINLTAPATAWTLKPAADNQTTIIPGGTLSTATVSGSSVLKGSAGNAVPATAADVVSLFSTCTGAQYLGADGACHTASSGLADPGSNGIVKRSALNTTTGAVAADVVGLFGPCSGTQYLGADSACHTFAGAGTVTVVGSGSLTSGALMTGGSGQTAQTPSAATMDASGNIATPGAISAGSDGTTAGVYTATGQDASGVVLAMGTYPTDPKKLYWQGHGGSNGTAFVYPDSTTGNFVIDAHQSGKLQLQEAGVNGNSITLDYSGAISAGTYTLAVPPVSGTLATSNPGYQSRTVPHIASGNNAVDIGVFTASAALSYSVYIEGSAYNTAKWYQFSASYTDSASTWSTVSPVSSTVSDGFDFALEIYSDNGGHFTWRLRRLDSGSADAGVSIYINAIGPNYSFAADSTLSNVSAPTRYWPSALLTQSNGIATFNAPLVASTLNRITLTAPTTAWTVQPLADNQTTIIPGGTLSTATVTGSSVLKGSGGNAVAAAASDVVALFASCSGTQYLGADGTCHAASSGGGTVTVVGSGSLASGALVTGAGAQAAQTPATSATMDSSGNISTPGTVTASSFTGTGTGPSYLALPQTSAPTVSAMAVTLYSPASVTGYLHMLPGAGASGIPHYGFASPNLTETISAIVAADTDNSIAHTGVDINTSHQVTALHLASPTTNALLKETSGGNAIPSGITDDGTNVSVPENILATNIAAPATPAAGKANVYVDSTQKVLSAKNDAGTVTHTVATSACSGGTPVVGNINADGSVTCAASGGNSSTATLNTQGSGFVLPWGQMDYVVGGSTTGATDLIVWQFVCCSNGVSIAARTISVESFTTASGAHIAAAIYADSGGSPGSLVIGGSGQATATQTALYSALSTVTTLTQGTVYWLALAIDNTTATFGVAGGTGGTSGLILGESSHPREGKCANAVSWSSGTPTFPAACGALSSLNAQKVPNVAILP
jgi:hypothetical protein